MSSGLGKDIILEVTSVNCWQISTIWFAGNLKLENFEAGQVLLIFPSIFRVAGLSSRNSELESANASLQKAMADRLREMEDRAANFRAEMARKVILKLLYRQTCNCFVMGENFQYKLRTQLNVIR